MISKDFSIETFVEAVKNRDSNTLITLAIVEATEADRIALRKRKNSKIAKAQTYSRQLKQLIDYHRYCVKFRRQSKTYNFYEKYWGNLCQSSDRLFQSSLCYGNKVDNRHM